MYSAAPVRNVLEASCWQLTAYIVLLFMDILYITLHALTLRLHVDHISPAVQHDS